MRGRGAAHTGITHDLSGISHNLISSFLHFTGVVLVFWQGVGNAEVVTMSGAFERVGWGGTAQHRTHRITG